MPKQSRKIRVNKKRSGTSPKKYYKKKISCTSYYQPWWVLHFFLYWKNLAHLASKCVLWTFSLFKKVQNLKNIAKASFKRKKTLKLKAIECEISSYTHFTILSFLLIMYCIQFQPIGLRKIKMFQLELYF